MMGMVLGFGCGICPPHIDPALIWLIKNAPPIELVKPNREALQQLRRQAEETIKEKN